jgi:hypothetical protein
MKDKVVLFQDGYARILTNPDVSDLQKLQEAGYKFLVNPDLSLVSHLSPEFWKLQADASIPIRPMSDSEQDERAQDAGMDVPFTPIVIEREVIKEVIVDRIVTVDREVIVEKLVEIEVPVEVVKTVHKLVFKEVEVPVEVVKFVPEYIEVPVEIIKEVFVDKIVEVPVEVPVKIYVQQINVVTPRWAYWLISALIAETIMVACYLLLQGAINGR